MMENVIEAMGLLDITPNLLVTTRSDHLPPGWDSHLFNDPLIFTDFCTEYLEFVLLMTRTGDKKNWRPPSNHQMLTLVKAVYQALPHELGQCMTVRYLSDTGLPTISITAEYEKDLGLIRHLIRNTTLGGYNFETIPTRYPLKTDPDRAEDILAKSAKQLTLKIKLTRTNFHSSSIPQCPRTAPKAPQKTYLQTMSINPSVESLNKHRGPHHNPTTIRSSIHFMIMLFNYFLGKQTASVIEDMARQIVTPRQLLPRGYDPPAFTSQLDTDIENDVIRFIVFCRPRSDEERRTGQLRVPTTATLWDTPCQDVAIRLYDQSVGTLTGPDLINPFRTFTSSESTGLTLFSVNYRDITIINRITAAIRRTIIDDMCFESFAVDIFDGVWAETRQLELVSEWYLITYSLPEAFLSPTNTFYSQDNAHRQCCGLALQPSGAALYFLLNKLFCRNKNTDRKKQHPIGKTSNLIQLCISPSYQPEDMIEGNGHSDITPLSWENITPAEFRSLLGDERHRQPRTNMLPFYILSSRGESIHAGWSALSGKTLQTVGTRAINFAHGIHKKYGNTVITDMLLLLSTLQPELTRDILNSVNRSSRGSVHYRAVPANLIVKEEMLLSPTARYGGYVTNRFYSNPLNSANSMKQVHRARNKEFCPSCNFGEAKDSRKSKTNLPTDQVTISLSPEPGRYLTTHPYRILFGNQPPFPPRTWRELMPERQDIEVSDSYLSSLCDGRQIRLILLTVDYGGAHDDPANPVWSLLDAPEFIEILGSASLNLHGGNLDKATKTMSRLLENCNPDTGSLWITPYDWISFDFFRLFIRATYKGNRRFETFPAYGIIEPGETPSQGRCRYGQNNICTMITNNSSLLPQADDPKERNPPGPEHFKHSHTVVYMCRLRLRVIVIANLPLINLNSFYPHTQIRSNNSFTSSVAVILLVKTLILTGHLLTSNIYYPEVSRRNFKQGFGEWKRRLTSYGTLLLLAKTTLGPKVSTSSDTEECMARPQMGENLADKTTWHLKVKPNSKNKNTSKYPSLSNYFIISIGPHINISNQEEGTPKPPRVEKMANTTTTQPEVSYQHSKCYNQYTILTNINLFTAGPCSDCIEDRASKLPGTAKHPTSLTQKKACQSLLGPKKWQTQQQHSVGYAIQTPDVTELSTTTHYSLISFYSLQGPAMISEKTALPNCLGLPNNNIFNPEEGMPKPPRAEIMASTTTTQHEVSHSYCRRVTNTNLYKMHINFYLFSTGLYIDHRKDRTHALHTVGKTAVKGHEGWTCKRHNKRYIRRREPHTPTKRQRKNNANRGYQEKDLPSQIMPKRDQVGSSQNLHANYYV